MADDTKTDDVKYGAVILTHEGDFKTEVFDTLDALTARLTELVDKDVSVACFAGQPLPISKPPFRHLLTPWGNKPLFVLPQGELEPDTTGYLGVDPVHLESPPTITTRPASPQGDDEFFGDDSGEAIDIFNGVLPDPDN